MLNLFNEKAQKVIVIAESIAFDLGNNVVDSGHLLLSLLKIEDCCLTKTLKQYHVNYEKINTDIIRLFGEKDIQPFYMEYSEVVKKILDDAIDLSRDIKEEKISVDTLSLAFLTEDESIGAELLRERDVSIKDIKIFIKNSRTKNQEGENKVMNRMNKIAKLLGIEMNVPFFMKNTEQNRVCISKYILRESGVYAFENSREVYKNNVIEFIFQGVLEIYEPPFTPKYNDIYEYFSMPDGFMQKKHWVNDFSDLMNFKTGNCFALQSNTDGIKFFEQLRENYENALKENEKFQK